MLIVLLAISAICLIIGVAKLLIAKHNLRVQTRKAEEVYSSMQNDIAGFFADFERLKSAYIPHSQVTSTLANYKSCFDTIGGIRIELLASERLKKVSQFRDQYARFEEIVEKQNDIFVKNEKQQCAALFSIDGKRLDDQQQTAVVSDEDYNLVIAGAGSGKTLTITAKVKYLCERKGISPKDILLIAFARKAAEEMTARVSKMGYSVEANTFHKFGLGIISEAKGIRPDVLDENGFRAFLEDYFTNKIMVSPTLVKALIEYFAYYLRIPADIENFDSLGAAYEYERNADFETLKSKYISNKADAFANNKRTLQGEFVKSLEEILIANFLFLNGINYEYERKYPFPTDDPYRKSYTPDFYLTDYDIYLEHFGINKQGRTPQLSEVEEQKYLEGIKWKRAIHKQNGTKLIETYSWYNTEGNLLSYLEKILRDNGVVFKEIDYDDVFSRIFNDVGDRYFHEFIQLCSTFITLFKANGYKIDDIDRLDYKTEEYKTSYHRRRTQLFKTIVKPILVDYQKMLEENGKVDFSDMILSATDIVKSGYRIPSYKYVIIDEFQDISISRYKLIKAVVEQTGAHLLCVGDDWQSIYRFSGSDLSVFTEFEQYFGFSKKTRIEKTYRNSQQLINSASSFIMKNPQQIRKALRSEKSLALPLQFYIHQDKPYSAIAAAIDSIIEEYGEDKDILLLGRTKYDKTVLLESTLFSIRMKGGNEHLVYRRNPNVKIEFMTVHKSKGLEADNVIILNFNNELLGFPNKIADDPILELTLSSADAFLYGEERRLLYVAMTRTKNSVAFIAENMHPSEFMHDFENDENVVLKNINCDESIVPISCPKCKTGKLLIRKNEKTGKQFAGCTNFPQCTYTVNDISIFYSPKKCSCGGFFLLRNGSKGQFYGCSNYPYCTNSMDLDGTPRLQSYSPSGNYRSERKAMKCECGGTLVLRNGRYGQFYGCSNYPRCKRTRDIN